MSSSSTATVGVRILLQDSATAGFNALGLSAQQLGYQFGMLSRVWGGLSPIQQDVAATTTLAGIAFGIFSGALGEVLDQGAQLGQALADVSIAVQGADAASGDMTNTLITLANNSIFTSASVAAGFDMMGEHGQNAAAIIGGDGQAMVDLAEAIQSGPVPAGELLSSVMQEFELNAAQAEDTANALTGAFYNGQPSVDGLMQALRKVAGQARELKIPLNDILTVLDILGQAGFTGALAGTALYNVLKNLTDPTKKASDALASLGLIIVNQDNPALQDLLDRTDALETKAGQVTLDGTLTSLQKLYDAAKKIGTLSTDDSFYVWALKNGFLDDKFFKADGSFAGLKNAIDAIGKSIQGLPPDVQLAKIQDIFNIRGSQGIDILVSDLAQIDPLWARIQNNLKNTSAAKDATIQIETMGGAFKRFSTTLQDLAGKIGNTLQPVLVPIIDKFNDLFTNLTLHHPALLKTIGLFLLIGTVITGLTFVVGAVTTAVAVFAVLGLGAVIGPAAIVVGSLLAVGAGVAWLVVHWNQVAKAVSPVTDAFKSFGNTVGPFIEQIGDTFRTSLMTVMPDLKSALADLQPTWNQLKQAFSDAKPLFDALMVVLKAVGVVIGTGLVIALSVLVAVIHGIAGALPPLITGLVFFFAGGFRAISGIIEIFVAILSAIFGTIYVLFTQGPTKALIYLELQVKNFFTGLKNLFTGGWIMIAGIFYVFFGTIIGFVWGFVKGIIGFFQHLFDMLVGHSIIPDMMKAIHLVITSVLNIIMAFVHFFVTVVVASFKFWWAVIQLGIALVVGHFGNFKAVLLDFYTTVKTGVIDPVVNSFQNLWDNIKNGIQVAKGFWNDLKNAILDFYNATIGKLLDLLNTIGKILNAQSSINSSHPGGTGPGSGQHAGSHAAGYITNGPEFALIGEGGEREIVAPVSKLIAAAQAAVGMGGNGNIIVPIYVDGREIARAQFDMTGRMLRSAGIGRRFR